MSVTTEQRPELEGRLLAYVQQSGSVRSAEQAILGARIRRQTGLRAFHALKQRGQICRSPDGRFFVPAEDRAEGVRRE